MDAANDVDTIGAVVTGAGDFQFVDSVNLQIETVNGVAGITTADGDIKVTTAGSLDIDDVVNSDATNKDTTLIAGTTIDQTEEIIAEG